MAKLKIKKLTVKELKEVKDLQNEINNILMNIGNSELVKNQMVAKHSELEDKWKAVTATLEEKYGSVNISLEDGSYTPTEPKAEAVEVEEV
jgi:predicted metal-dependent hydrolase